MLKLPKGLKKKKKKSKKDKELFTEEELEQYKRELRAKQEAAAAKSDVGESDGASDAEASTSSAHPVPAVGVGAGAGAAAASLYSSSTATTFAGETHVAEDTSNKKSGEDDEEWAKFKALTSGVDSILHKTQDELDRIKKESFYQRLPSAAEKKKLEEEEAARLDAERLEEERRKAAEFEAQRDKLAEAVVQLSESDGEAEEEDIDDIFATDYIEAITSGEVQLGVVDFPDLELDLGPDPFDTAYAEKVIVGADKAKGNKKLVSLGAAVEVLSGRVDREHAVALAKPKRKLRKGIQNLLLSDSVDLGDVDESELAAPEPQKNLLDELDIDVPDSDAPIDLSISLHLQLIKPKKQTEDDDKETAEEGGESGVHNYTEPDLSEFDVLKDDEDDEFAELAVESLNKKEDVQVITQIPLQQTPAVLTENITGDWAEFEQLPEDLQNASDKPSRPPPPVRPTSGPHIVPGAIYISDDEDTADNDDPFNTSYAENVIKNTTVLEEDNDFDPRAGDDIGSASAQYKVGPPARPAPPPFLVQPARDLLGGSTTDLSKVGPAPIPPTEISGCDDDDFDPFDTSAINEIVQPKATELKFIERELLTQQQGRGTLADSAEASLKKSLSDPDFDPRADEVTSKAPPPRPAAPPVVQLHAKTPSIDFDTARRKSSLSLNIQQAKTVGFLVPTNQDLLGSTHEGASNKKPLTPYYAPPSVAASSDPFDTSYVPEVKPSDVELKHIAKDLLTKNTLKHSLSDPDFDPRAPPTPIPAEELLTVQEDIKTKVLTPQESRDLVEDNAEFVDPFDTSIASNLQPGRTELKLLESELLTDRTPEITTGVLDTLTDAQELGLGDKVLTPSVPSRQITLPEDVDPFDTSIADNLAPGETEIKLLESELIDR